MKRKTIEDYKKEAPEIPTNTCPYINFAKDIIGEIKDETNNYFVNEKLSVIECLLEYIRESNDSLRQSGEYWYRSFLNKK
jgi:hypothetical protein